MVEQQKKIALVIPTIREKNFNDFVERWKSLDLFSLVDLVVMEDNPTKTFPTPSDIGCTHLSWQDIDAALGKDSWIIPRRSDTVRSYGYYFAWKMGYEYILTLDDDCYPTGKEDGLIYDGEGFIKSHLTQLTGRTRWFNTLNSVKPRGIPFYNVGKQDKVIVNHGLWTNVLDYDAPYQLANPIKEEFSFDNRIVPAGQYFPMCGMNVMWDSHATVLMYHLLMGQQIRTEGALLGYSSLQDDGTFIRTPATDKLPFDRFGDIWCGILMKKIADMTGHLVATGMPYIRHERASNPFTNLRKEANGIEVNEDFWQHIDEFNVHQDEHFGLYYLYEELGKHVAKFTDAWPKYKEHEAYFKKLGEAMQIWARLFSVKP